MKKTYSGLEAIKVSLDAKDQICVSNVTSDCYSIVTLVMENYVCISPVEMRAVEWYLENE